MTNLETSDPAINRAAEVAQAAVSALGVPQPLAHIPIAGAMYLEAMCAPSPDIWWPTADKSDEVGNWLTQQHCELSLSVSFALSLARLIGRPPKLDWQLEFDVAYLFFTKSCAQAGASIQLLTNSGCYADAFVVLRSLHGRVNLLTLMALGTHLFDEWLKSPKDPKFLDGNVRKELANHGVYTFPHFYEHASEITHAQFTALSEVGYMEMGLFPRIPSIENRILASAKLLFGIIGSVGLSMLSLEPREN